MDKMKRVYHPTLNAWQDVASGDVSEWTAAGWKTTKPAHIDDSDSLPVGEGYRPPAVRFEPNTVEAEPVPDRPASKSK